MDQPDFNILNELPNLINALEEKKTRIEGKLFLLQEYELMGKIIRKHSSEITPKTLDVHMTRLMENPNTMGGNPFSIMADFFVELIADEDFKSIASEIGRIPLQFGLPLSMINIFSYLPHDSGLVQEYIQRLYQLSKIFLPWLFKLVLTDDSVSPVSEEDSQTLEYIKKIEALGKKDDPEYVQFFQTECVDTLVLFKTIDEQNTSNIDDDFISYLDRAVKAFHLDANSEN